MPRAPDPNKEMAKQLYLKGKKLIEIASQLHLPEGTIRSWKNRYKWNCNATKKNCNVAKNKGGAPKGNKNATGGTPKNKNAVKNHLFEKYLPKETLDIVNSISSKSPIDLLWEQIQLQYAAILRAQQLNYVKDQQDKTTERIAEQSGNVDGEKWQVQEAWDKHNAFLSAQSRAMAALRGLIKQYDEMLNSDLATEEQKLRIEKLRAETAKLNGTDNQDALNKLNEVLGSIKGVV